MYGIAKLFAGYLLTLGMVNYTCILDNGRRRYWGVEFPSDESFEASGHWTGTVGKGVQRCGATVSLKHGFPKSRNSNISWNKKIGSFFTWLHFLEFRFRPGAKRFFEIFKASSALKQGNFVQDASQWQCGIAKPWQNTWWTHEPSCKGGRCIIERGL